MEIEQPQKRIQQSIRQGRGDRMDWLQDQAGITQIAVTLAAMANSEGGTVLFGVDNSQVPQLVGVKDDVLAIDQILQAALSLQPPLIIPMPRVVNVDGVTIIETTIPAGMPHVYSMGGRYLTRKGTGNVALEPAQLRRLFIQRGEISFESEAVMGCTLDDIDWDKVRTYVDDLERLSDLDEREVLLRRGCLLRRDDGSLRPTNAGILLFGNDPQRFIRGADITAVRFAGETMSDTFSRQDIVGTLPDQIRRAETFLVDHLRKGVALGGTMVRTEHYEYPMEAARELVVNAVAHRDYSVRGDGIRLYIFRDRMEVSNPGGLAGPVTLANIKDARFSRNPVIVQVLSDMGYIERLGYGVDRVLELMKSQNLREPEFEERQGGFLVTMYKQASAVEKAPDRSESQRSPELIRLLAELRDSPMNPRQESALDYLLRPENHRITNSELQNQFPDVHAETIRRDLADLVAKDVLVKKGQKRGSYYVLKRNEMLENS